MRDGEELVKKEVVMIREKVGTQSRDQTTSTGVTLER